LGHVHVYLLGPSGPLETTTADADGAYKFEFLSPGTYQVVVGDPGSPGAARTTITPGSVGDITADLSVAVAGIITGHVFAADGTTPLGGVSVSLSENGDALTAMDSE